MKKYNTIEITVEKKITTVWLNRPSVHNAFNSEMIAEITDCFNNINNEQDISIVLLRGKEKSFCAGADLNWMRDVSKQSYDENLKESKKLYDCFFSIYKCPKPTIAIVHGVALGGANGLLSACDITYCIDSTIFAFSEVKIGIVPATISPFVIKRIGEFGAKELMLTGRRINGKEAENYKLVNKSFKSIESLENYVSIIIEQLKTSGPNAITNCKILIYDVCNDLTFSETQKYTAKMIADIRASKEGQEGMAAFLEKRKPNWIK
ncbi:MAG: hypothetical protein A2X08_11165 [Bacteroidetes bacterium GWA2_32_17]|nr:MAG: hypothetical protein A2X08_11165 [Bacteroidetes bacterium GWA2_32_17]